MTELNRSTQSDLEEAETRASWPALPPAPSHPAGHVPSTDHAVAALLERLSALPELPVDRHQEVYAGLHDDLLAALNEDVAGGAAAAQAGKHETAVTTKTGDATHGQA
ncbi:MAG TPA: hypothetical protein VLT34_03760 [Arthrobacter sp.]|nr:hypothetical protein [Arthrobacter sp.]